MRPIPVHKSYAAKLAKAGGKVAAGFWMSVPGVREFEHYRFKYPVRQRFVKLSGVQWVDDFAHAAVVVGEDGKCWLGIARPNGKSPDVYNRKVGFAIAMGRAVEKWYTFANYPRVFEDFKVSKDLRGVQLRDAVLKEVVVIVQEIYSKNQVHWIPPASWSGGVGSGTPVPKGSRGREVALHRPGASGGAE